AGAPAWRPGEPPGRRRSRLAAGRLWPARRGGRQPRRHAEVHHAHRPRACPSVDVGGQPRRRRGGAQPALRVGAPDGPSGRAGGPAAENCYGRMLPRLAWAAFELDGAEWRAIAQRRAVTAKADGTRFDPDASSRLVPIDVARDAATLVRRHAGQPVIVMRVLV